MGQTRKRFSSEFKAKVALEAIKGHKTTAEISSEHGVHVSQINQWKKELRDALPGIFSGKNDTEAKDKEKLIERLYSQIGRLQVENDWFKKKLPF